MKNPIDYESAESIEELKYNLEMARGNVDDLRRIRDELIEEVENLEEAKTDYSVKYKILEEENSKLYLMLEKYIGDNLNCKEKILSLEWKLSRKTEEYLAIRRGYDLSNEMIHNLEEKIKELKDGQSSSSV